MNKKTGGKMQVKIASKDKQTAVVEVSGEINFECYAEFLKTATAVLVETPVSLIIDMSGVNYVDSCGIASFVELFQKCRKQKIKVQLKGVQPRVQEVFKATRLDTLI